MSTRVRKMVSLPSTQRAAHHGGVGQGRFRRAHRDRRPGHDEEKLGQEMPPIESSVPATRFREPRDRAEPQIGALLPCNVVGEDAAGGVHIE